MAMLVLLFTVKRNLLLNQLSLLLYPMIHRVFIHSSWFTELDPRHSSLLKSTVDSVSGWGQDQNEPCKKKTTCYIPFYWLVNRDF